MKFSNRNKQSLPHWAKVQVSMSPPYQGRRSYDKLKRFCQLLGSDSRFFIGQDYDRPPVIDPYTFIGVTSLYTIYFENSADATLFGLLYETNKD